MEIDVLDGHDGTKTDVEARNKAWSESGTTLRKKSKQRPARVCATELLLNQRHVVMMNFLSFLFSLSVKRDRRERRDTSCRRFIVGIYI